jgi:hypothetical protein
LYPSPGVDVVPPVALKGVGVVTEFVALDATDVPLVFVAVTVKVYVVLALNPVTVIGELEALAVTPPGDDVTV